jgi:hypothetical protein
VEGYKSEMRLGLDHLVGKESVVCRARLAGYLVRWGTFTCPQAEQKSAPDDIGQAIRGHTFRTLRSQKRDRFLAPKSAPLLISFMFSYAKA